jgi:hypothetical protein
MMAKAKGTRWGYSLDDWAAACEQARTALIAHARARETIAYSELCEELTVASFRPYSWALMALIDEVCRDEDERTGAVLATLVVRRDTRMPGDGYFAWAARTGADVSDRDAFWRAQAERVWDAYTGE